jgi:hypothetical protein
MLMRVSRWRSRMELMLGEIVAYIGADAEAEVEIEVEVEVEAAAEVEALKSIVAWGLSLSVAWLD